MPTASTPIVRSTGHRSVDVLESQFRNSSQRCVDLVNKKRAASGLPTLFDAGRPWMRSATPRAPRRAPALRSYVLVSTIGVGDISRGPQVEPEVIEPGAFDASHRLIRAGRLPFVFRGFGHGTRAIDAAGSGSFELSSLYRDFGVCIWRPDPKDQTHRDVCEQIESGTRSLSIEFATHRAAWVDGVRHVYEATLRGVALVEPGSVPAYRGSLAIAADVRPSHVERSILRCVSLCRSVAAGDIEADAVERAIQRLGV